VNSSKQKEFLELYNPVHSQFVRFCRAISGNVKDSEDLVNDTVLTVFSQLEKIAKKDKDQLDQIVFKLVTIDGDTITGHYKGYLKYTALE